MTPTEIIATKLLGWEPAPMTNQSQWRRYKHPTKPHYVLIRLDGSPCGSLVSDAWPDFTTLDWCRLFEDALRNKGWWYEYAKNLYFAMPDEAFMGIARHTLAFACLFATPAQRFAACLKVIEEDK